MTATTSRRASAGAGSADDQLLPRSSIIDCDIHNVLSPGSLDPYLSDRWRRHQRTFGHRRPTGNLYPKGSPNAARTDAIPPSGLAPGADLGFMQHQHLDPMGVEYGVLNCLGGGPTQLDVEHGAALCRATNDWQIDEWHAKDPRLRCGTVVPTENGALAAREIDRLAGHPAFVQVLLLARTSAPLGDRRYWPIYEAAARHDLPVGVHFGGEAGVPVTATGRPSFYIEDHVVMSSAFQAHVTSLVLSGVFDHLPNLRLAMIEGGFAWLPSLMWRLDAQWRRFGAEVPHLRRRPSDYVADHFWFTTQPMEEPQRRTDLLTVFEHLGGVDKIMFSTDYPHWDFDSPVHALRVKLPTGQREQIYSENAREFYRLPARADHGEDHPRGRRRGTNRAASGRRRRASGSARTFSCWPAGPGSCSTADVPTTAETRTAFRARSAPAT